MVVARSRPGERLFLPCRVVEPRPVRGLLLASERALGLVAAHSKVKVVVMRITAGRLVKHPGRSKERARGALMAGSVAKQTGFDVIGAEDPLDPRLLVENQSPNEVPVAPIVELECATSDNGPPEAVEAHPAGIRCRKTSRVFHEEQDVRIAPRSMTSMTRVGAAEGS